MRVLVIITLLLAVVGLATMVKVLAGPDDGRTVTTPRHTETACEQEGTCASQSRPPADYGQTVAVDQPTEESDASPIVRLGDVLNVWQGPQITLPIPVGEGEFYVAHGDVHGIPNDCNVVLFEPGDLVDGLSAGTWRLVHYTGGTPRQRRATVDAIHEQVC